MRHWILAARPKTLLAGICPVVLGCALADLDSGFHWLSALAALLGAMSIQIGTNFCNDYFDFLQGADTSERKGPTRAVQAGLISQQSMRTATVLMFSITVVATIYLVYRAGWPIIVIGFLSILFGVLYTAGRYSLAYLGLGDVFVLIFFGPVAVCGTHFVQTLQPVSLRTMIAGLGPGLIAVGILVVNNLRDVHEDRLAGKKTLAVRFGENFVRWEFTFCMALAAGVPILLIVRDDLPRSAVVVSLAAIPGLFIARKLWSVAGKELNPYLGKTAAVLLQYTLIFSIGCLCLW